MAKNAITDFSTTAASNTDVGGVDIQGTAPASNMDDSVREVMAILADTNAGTAPWADTMTIGDAADLTKEVRFELSGITTATTRVLTVPNYDGTIATLAGTETLTNKTLTSPTVTGLDASATAKGLVELATDAEAQTGTDTARAITAANLQAVTATETRKGVIELATTAEAAAGTDTARAVTAAGVAAAIPALTAALSYGGIGTYVLGYVRGTGLIANATIAGSSIEPAGFHSSSEITPDDDAVSPTAMTKGGAALSGTWRIMGQANNTTGGTQSRVTLFLRIS